MSKIEEITDNYYIAIQEYDNYLNSKDFNSNNHNINSMQRTLLSVFQRNYEKDYMPWRNLKGDIKHNLLNIFNTKSMEKVVPYLRAGDEVGDALTISAEQDLTKYYLKEGYDINDDEIYDKILEEACNISNYDKLDSNIYSKDTISLFLIDKKFGNACDDLYKYCRGYYDEIEMEI